MRVIVYIFATLYLATVSYADQPRSNEELDGYLAKGTAYLSQNRYDEAIAEYRKIVDHDYDEIRLRTARHWILICLEKKAESIRKDTDALADIYREAVALFQDTDRADQALLWAGVRLSTTQHQMGTYGLLDETLEYYQRFVERSPSDSNSPIAYLLLADVLRQQKNWARLEKIGQQAPVSDSPEFSFFMALALGERYTVTKDRTYLWQYIDALEEITRGYPKSLEASLAYLCLGNMYADRSTQIYVSVADDLLRLGEEAKSYEPKASLQWGDDQAYQKSYHLLRMGRLVSFRLTLDGGWYHPVSTIRIEDTGFKRYESAISLYEQTISKAYNWDNVLKESAYLGIARSCEAMGDVRKTKKAYKDILALPADGTREQRALMQEAAEMLEKLNAHEGERVWHHLSTGYDAWYSPPELPVTIGIDQDGSLWFGSGKGLSRYDGDKWRVYHAADGLPDTVIASIAIDRDGTRWFGTRKGIARFDGQSWKTYNERDGLIDNFVYALAIDSMNRTWIGTYGGISVFDGTSWTTYTTADGLIDNRVRCIAIDDNGCTWFGTENGLSMFDGQRWVSYPPTDGFLGHSVRALAIDHKGRQWIGTEAGMSMFDGNTWTRYGQKEAPRYAPLGSITGIVVDGKDTPWICTKEGKVYTWFQDTWIDKTPDSALPMTNLAIDNTHRLWLASLEKSSAFDGTRWSDWIPTHSFPQGTVHQVIADRKGMRWFATDNGVFQFDGHYWYHHIPNKAVYTALIDSHSNKWFGSEDGVLRFDGKHWISYTGPDTPDRAVYASAVDLAGHVWFGMVDGTVSRFDGSTWTTYTSEGLVESTIHTIAIDSSGNVWFASNVGVSKFDGTRWAIYGEEDGLGERPITYITIDKKGRPWVKDQYSSRVFTGELWQRKEMSE